MIVMRDDDALEWLVKLRCLLKEGKPTEAYVMICASIKHLESVKNKETIVTKL